MFLEAHFSVRDTSKPISTENCGLTFPPFAAQLKMVRESPILNGGASVAFAFTNQDGIIFIEAYDSRKSHGKIGDYKRTGWLDN